VITIASIVVLLTTEQNAFHVLRNLQLAS